MSNAPTVEDRIENLEKELAEVKQRIGMGQGQADWLSSIVGSMAKYPEFKEVVRLGREIRQADRPDAEQ